MHQLPHVNNQELLSISFPTVRNIDQTTINQDRGRNDVNLPLNDSCFKKKKKKQYHCNQILCEKSSLYRSFYLHRILYRILKVTTSILMIIDDEIRFNDNVQRSYIHDHNLILNIALSKHVAIKRLSYYLLPNYQ